MADYINRAYFSISNAPSTTGAFTVSTAESGYRTLVAADDGKSLDVLAIEGTAWEVRTGCAYTHSGTSLARGTLEESSTGSAIDFTNAAKIMVTVVASAARDIPAGRVLADFGEAVMTHGTQTTAVTLDVEDGHVHTLTTTSATGITITLDNTKGHTGTSLTLLLTKAGTETITWAGDFNGSTGWIGGAPDLGAADVYVIFFHWLGSGTVCYAVYGGAL